MSNIQIVITESQYKKLIESQVNELDFFWKPIYDSESKNLDVAYYLWNETPDSYKILNIVEKEKPITWASGAKDYNIQPKSAFLPRKFVEKLEEIPNKPGYFHFKVPYWLYRKDSSLAVERIPTSDKKFTTLNLSDDFYKMLSNSKFMDALLGVEIKKEFLDRLNTGYQKRLEIRNKPKDNDNSSQNTGNFYSSEKESQVWRNIRSSSLDQDSTDQSVQEN